MARRVRIGLLAISVLLPVLPAAERTHKVIFIAGTKSHGIGAHEYLRSVKLLKVALDRSPNLKGITSEVYFNGWPDDPRALDTADTIVAITDGQPSDTQALMPLMTDDRMPILEKQMKRGCGLVLIHYSTFLTYKYAEQMLGWEGAYYEWKGPKEGQSLIKTLDTDLVLPSADHPVVQGIAPFKLKDEYYYKLHLLERAPGFRPIVRVPALSGNPSEQTVAWAIERSGGGRGFGTTTGHVFANWQNESYRKLILNAIVWTAGMTVPKDGVESSYWDEAEVNKALLVRPIPTLLVSGTSKNELDAAVASALNSEIPRFQITETSLKDLGHHTARKYKLIVFSYCDENLDETITKQLKNYRGGIVCMRGSAVLASQPDKPLKVNISSSKHPAIHDILSYETKDNMVPPPINQTGGLVLATITGSADEREVPVAIAFETGKKRAFQLNLGRDITAIAVPGTTQLIRYGSLWAARE